MGDCLKVGGTPDRPEAIKVQCGSRDSNFKVAAAVENRDQCPVLLDVGSYYSMQRLQRYRHDGLHGHRLGVVDGCMSVDPENDRDPFRVDCHDTSVPNRQRATQILKNIASVDQCTSGIGYAYDERQFTVCVEDVS